MGLSQRIQRPNDKGLSITYHALIVIDFAMEHAVRIKSPSRAVTVTQNELRVVAGISILQFNTKRAIEVDIGIGKELAVFLLAREITTIFAPEVPLLGVDSAQRRETNENGTGEFHVYV